MKKLTLLAAVAVIVVGGSGSAKASVIYDLTSNHCSDATACGSPGTIFGNVTLDQNGANVDITVALNNPPYVWAKTGSVDDMAFKFNATGVVLGDITVNQTFAGQTLAAATGALNGDGTGNFVFGIQCTTCGGGLSTVVFSNIVFHVANATIADLTAPNNLGNVFVADIGNSTNGATGPIDASTPHTPVPEPISLSLVGGGLLALGLFRKRFVA
jgi:hypothetical protein